MQGRRASRPQRSSHSSRAPARTRPPRAATAGGRAGSCQDRQRRVRAPDSNTRATITQRVPMIRHALKAQAAAHA